MEATVLSPLSMQFTRPVAGVEGVVGRIVAYTQGIEWRSPHLPGHPDVGAIAHTRMLLEPSAVGEMTFPESRLLSLGEANRTPHIWRQPPFELSPRELARLHDVAIGMLNMRYSVLSLLRFKLLGTLGKGGLVCSSWIATLLHEALDLDVSGCGQPWNVTPRDLLVYTGSWPTVTT